MKIIIIDDDKLVCSSLKTILQAEEDIEVIAFGTSGEEAIELCRKSLPDILLMDIQMGGFSGLEAGEIILKEFPNAQILYLTTFADNEYVVKALRIGAKGYLIKQNTEAIAPALRSVMSGQSVFGSEVVTMLPNLMENKKESDLSDYDLSDREKEVIQAVAKGLSNKEIADNLYLSEGTVRNYLSVILDKLQLRDRTQLAVFYYKNIKS